MSQKKKNSVLSEVYEKSDITKCYLCEKPKRERKQSEEHSNKSFVPITGCKEFSHRCLFLFVYRIYHESD